MHMHMHMHMDMDATQGVAAHLLARVLYWCE